MPLSTIVNGESSANARTKINDAITQLNGFPTKVTIKTTLTNGANTIASPGGSPSDGNERRYYLKQPASGAAGTITFNAIFVFPDGYIPNVSTSNSRTDLMEAIYESVSSKWIVTKFIGGLSI